jgi:hypothetical protein
MTGTYEGNTAEVLVQARVVRMVACWRVQSVDTRDALIPDDTVRCKAGWQIVGLLVRRFVFLSFFRCQPPRSERSRGSSCACLLVCSSHATSTTHGD